MSPVIVGLELVDGLLLSAVGFMLITRRSAHPFQWLGMVLLGKRKPKKAKVSAIEDLCTFKKEMRKRQVRDWEAAWIAVAPPRPTNVTVYNERVGYYVEDHTPGELWDEEWMPWIFQRGGLTKRTYRK